MGLIVLQSAAWAYSGLRLTAGCVKIAAMDEATAIALNEINRAFYVQTADDFSETRQAAWPGWLRLAEHLPSKEPARVLDVGCGNGRFGVFLAGHFPARAWLYHGIDNSPALLDHARTSLAVLPGLTVTLEQQDVIFQPLPDAVYDLIAVFGVLHHIPGLQRRTEFVRRLAAGVAPGGVLALAAWRFFEYDRFRKRIVPWPETLSQHVEPGDHLLDWRRGTHALRYCHAIDDDEFSLLISATGLQHIDRYRADGFSGAVNDYALLMRS